MTTDPAERRRLLDEELAQKAAWTVALGSRANFHGGVSAEGYEEAKREAGIEPAPPTELPEPEPEPTPPGDGGAVEQGSPRPPGALDQLIREAEQKGDHARAISLKNLQLLAIQERQEGNRNR
jgi:hypothetical protein